jgi:fermentation-respiration switch protein FrsA (DUF1100 family)
LKAALLFAALLLAVAYGLLRLVARSATYYPLRYPDGLWNRQQEAGATEVWLTTRDGVRLNAWWMEPSGARLATLFLHGNGGNLTHRIHHMRQLARAGSALLIPDYRGYGKSGGAPSESGLYDDADAAWQWLIDRGWKPERIVIHGESLGTAVAVDLASRQRCAGVVLEAPFNSAGAVAGTALPVVGPLVMRGFDSKAKIARVRAPLLCIHGDRDEVIAYRLGRDLYESAPAPKSFWTVQGAGHNDLIDAAGESYVDRLRKFYKDLK